MEVRIPSMSGEPWQELYAGLRPPMLHRAVTGFNVNLDRIIPVSRELLQSPLFSWKDMTEVRAKLFHSMQTCTADELFVQDPAQYQRLAGLFSGSGALAIGGQAGIAAVHLASAGVPAVLCAAPAMGRMTREILLGSGVIIPDLGTGLSGGQDTVHLVFEYQPGLIPVLEGVVPRNNRFIVSPVHEPASVLVPEGSTDLFLEAIAGCTRAFLSGYQYLRSDRDFAAAARQLRMMKRHNPDLKIHTEWVTVRDRDIIGRFIRFIIPETDSLGLNEYELALLGGDLEPSGMWSVDGGDVSPARLVKGALEVCRATGLSRLHVHTFGWYVLIHRKESGELSGSRNALLFASREAAKAAQGKGSVISPDGIRAIGQVSHAFGQERSAGLFRDGDFFIILVPAMIAAGVTRTAGMGDRISSAAFVADPF